MPAYPSWGAAAPLLLLALVAALATAVAIPPMMPLLRRYALARPNARSSHKVPTPQGGGIAIAGVWLALLLIVLVSVPGMPAGERLSLAMVAAAVAVLAVLGGVDDIRPLPALGRLLVQFAACAAVVATLPGDEQVLPGLLPLAVERVVLLVGLVWFVNLTNFMDGIDWITAAGFVPLGAALLLLAAAGVAGPAVGLAGALVAGGLLGFAPYNKPVARLFLGDVGSLPVGLLAGYGLIRLAGEGHLVAALILPLYYIADATITLLRRLRAGERVWDAHRSHFYQRATTNGYRVIEVVTRIGLVDLVLAVTGALLALAPTPGRLALGLVVAVCCVASLLVTFNKSRTGAATPTAP
jgi:UDP-N-acetylmuramyl pentapeptide phosphotransferase/UDP-N-acetylglucosamine-1-phosphate transferase